LAARNAEVTEPTPTEPVIKVIEPLPPPPKKLAPAEIEAEVLAEARTVAKV
jgi:hypothetical protein